MARKNAKRNGMKNIQPSEMTLTFATPTTVAGTNQNFYLDLSQVASLVNRRFYRQGLNWAVSGFKILTGGPNQKGLVTVQKLPNSWVMGNSWVKGFSTWNEMNKNALEEAESVKGRFLDFKIYADAAHHTLGYVANLLPLNYQGISTPGEWIPSEIRVPNSITNNTTSGFELIATGDNYPGVSAATGKNAVSLIKGYANSRALPAVVDPNTPSEAIDAGPSATPENWMSALHNEGVTQDSDVLADVTAYDQPPYPYENDGVHVGTMYPGGETQLPGLMIHDQVPYTSTTIGGTAYAKGGNFPCGLVKFYHSVDAESITHNLSIQVDLVPGPHRGYMAESMMEF